MGVAGPACHYRANGDLPDQTCTPGAIDPAVTQDNIRETICKPGYAASVRPPLSVTEPIKRDRMAAYGVSNQPTRDYELDHLVPLELGGAPRDVANLWPEKGIPNPKDKAENRLHALVCSGQMSLADAQQQIETDWRTVR